MKTQLTGLLLGLGIASSGMAWENRLPEGYDLKDRISFEYDKEQCGELDFHLDDNHDCTIEFDDFLPPLTSKKSVIVR